MKIIEGLHNANQKQDWLKTVLKYKFITKSLIFLFLDQLANINKLFNKKIRKNEETKRKRTTRIFNDNKYPIFLQYFVSLVIISNY
ncbi:hypothetical protein BpHYR1_054575 [Brachionus plicatilis]|uniref:Uncharacterized protein n=1 Tax=Brachionus plicatilis TaxID=10195 RepID=A0A3M7R6V3_BRAPC|nr:hypothetical protein BpHYR1_054575 [Brachionus plicatilis]